jgi:hypothetical protein
LMRKRLLETEQRYSLSFAWMQVVPLHPPMLHISYRSKHAPYPYSSPCND